MCEATQNHSDVVRLLSGDSADVNARSAKTSFPEQTFSIAGMLTTYLPQGKWTPLMYAARDNALESARLLAEAHADLNAQDPDGTTALVLAIINAHYDLAAMLLEHGADPNVA